MSTIRAALFALGLAALLAPPPARGAASAWAENEQSRVRLVTEYATAPRSGPIRLGLHFTLSPGWHVYWKNSGDAGFPPVVTFASTGGALREAGILWPAPRRFELPGGLVAFGYEGEAVYPIQAGLQVPEDAAAEEPVQITAEVDYLVCEVDCIPYRYTLALTQPVGDEPAADPETSQLLDSWWARLPKPAAEIPGVQTGALVHAGDPEKLELEVRVRGTQAGEGETDLFLETHEAFETGKPQAKVAGDEVIFRVPLAAKEAGRELPAKTVFAWTVTGLTGDGGPVSLQARREVEVSREPAAGEPAAAPAPAGETGAAYRTRLFRLLLLALLGGLLLNLTPTVLPLLLGELVELRSDPGGRPAVREGAAAAATGVLGSSMALAALAVAARRAGLPAGWGAQLQEPALAALILVAAVVLTLNLWGLLDGPLPPADPAEGLQRRGTARHLLAGLLATPLALAWTLPLLREPVGFAAERGTAVTLTVLAALGLGLALPYLVLLLAPAMIRIVPAPGRWSRVLREGMGFLAGASTFWVLYALSRQVSPEGIAWVELALLVMGLLAWLRHRAVSRTALRFGLAVALAACAGAALWLADDNRLTPRPSRTVESQRTIADRRLIMRQWISTTCVLAVLALAAAPAFAAGTVGETAPPFQLKGIDGKTYSLADYKGKVVVLEWVNPNCPFSDRHAREKTMSDLARQHGEVVWLGINSTSASHANYLQPAEHQAWAKKNGVSYAILYDAKTTPHMFIIDQAGKIAYNGAIDDDPPGRKAKAERANYVAQGLGAEKAGRNPDPATTKPYGCSIKY